MQCHCTAQKHKMTYFFLLLIIKRRPEHPDTKIVSAPYLFKKYSFPSLITQMAEHLFLLQLAQF